MIRLQKTTEPAILAANAVAWTTDLENAIAEAKANGTTVPNRLWIKYAHDDVKAAVIAEAHGKCVYCESKMRHVDSGDIEHIIPKKKFPRETYRWENLALACGECNRRKNDEYDPGTPPVNPFLDEPDDFIFAAGPFLHARAGSDRGEVTVNLAELNRPELVEKRDEHLRKLRRLADCVARAGGAAREILREELRAELRREKEYIMASRAMIAAMGVAV